MGSADEQLLIDALDALEKGESVDSILANYPSNEAELRPVLETTARLAQFRVAYSLESQSSSKRKFLERAQELRVGAEKPKVFASYFRRIALPVVPLVLVLVILAAGIAFASRSAIPGDALYGAKRAVEDLRFTLTIDSKARQTLSSAFEEERIREINALLREGKSADVEFSGFIEVIGTDSWIVAGIRVQLDSETKIDGLPNVGYRALVKGKATGGRLTALEVIVKGNGLTLPEIVPTRSKIGPPELVTPPATEFPTSTEQPSPTPTETPSPTITHTPSPSPEPSPLAPVTATPGDDSLVDDDDGSGGDSVKDDGVGDDNECVEDDCVEDDGVGDDGVGDDSVGDDDDCVEDSCVEDVGVEDDGVEDDGVEDDGRRNDDGKSGNDGSMG